MVKSFKQQLNNLDTTFIFAVLFTVIISIVTTWLMVSYLFNEIVQGVLYPYSDYPVIVSSAADILIIPGFIAMWLAVFIGISDILFKLFENTFYEKLKAKLGKAVGIVLIISIIAFVTNYFTWQVAAHSNGYTQCASGSKLLLGSKISFAWSKEVYLCDDYNVDKLLSTGTHDQVVEVARYLKSN